MPTCAEERHGYLNCESSLVETGEGDTLHRVASIVKQGPPLRGLATRDQGTQAAKL